MKRPYNPEREQKLEELIQRELSQLPERQAPPTLIPRVMAAIQAQTRRPWWQRSFQHWPRPWQMTFLLVLGGVLGVFVYGFNLSWAEWTAASSLAQETRQNLAFLEALAETAGALVNAVRLAARTLLIHPAAWAGIGMVGLVYLSCVGMGTLWYQLAFNKGSR
jgi:hypothetical protein